MKAKSKNWHWAFFFFKSFFKLLFLYIRKFHEHRILNLADMFLCPLNVSSLFMSLCFHTFSLVSLSHSLPFSFSVLPLALFFLPSPTFFFHSSLICHLSLRCKHMMSFVRETYIKECFSAPQGVAITLTKRPKSSG